MRSFDPWVGKNYWNDGLCGCRVLILGESHYGIEGEETLSFTIDVVRKWGQEERFPFFTKVQQLFEKDPSAWLSTEQRSQFWDCVAFYNYIQCFVGDEARIRPTEAMWQGAVADFKRTIDDLRPQLLVVLGVALMDRLPSIDVNAVVCGVPHPSSYGYRSVQWQPVVAEALLSVKNCFLD